MFVTLCMVVHRGHPSSVQETAFWLQTHKNRVFLQVIASRRPTQKWVSCSEVLPQNIVYSTEDGWPMCASISMHIFVSDSDFNGNCNSFGVLWSAFILKYWLKITHPPKKLHRHWHISVYISSTDNH